MPCPYCAAPTTTEMVRRTTLGYRMFHCRACRRTCNERTGTPFNHLQVPTDIAVLVVLWRFHYKLGLRNVAEMFLTRVCWPLRSSAPDLLSVPHHGTGVIRRSRHGTYAAVSAARADALAILAHSSRARMSQTASTAVCSKMI